ncbi:MAG: metallopeptidase family protein [Acidimicrobiales bacterium]
MELIGFQRFEELVGEALDLLPDELFDAMDNVAFVVIDGDDPDLLGLYDGVPLTERGMDYSAVMPDRISIFRNTICAICETEDEVIEEVRVTVLHEIAHHFGIDDDRLDELGWA